MTQSRTVTQADIAMRAGVSAATVSYALSGKSGVSALEAKRIQRLAEKMGYRPSPLLAVHMAHVRRRTVRPFQATLGFISTSDSALRSVYVEAARVRAEQIGYLLEEFHLPKLRLSPQRLSAILLNRGIPGLIIGESPENFTRLDLDWNQFSAVTLGYTLIHPNLHRACHAHFRGMTRTLQFLWSKGFRRIGYVHRPGDLIRGERMQHAAFLEFHASLGLAPGPTLQITSLDPTPFLHWLECCQADAVVSAENRVREWLEVEAPKTAYSSLCLDADDYLRPGIKQGYPQVAAAAIDLLIAQLLRNDRGIPKWPNIVLVEGNWQDSAST